LEHMSKKRIDAIVDEWHEIWRKQAQEAGENPDHIISREYLKEEAYKGPFCRECGIPCSSYGWGKKGVRCLYCAAEDPNELNLFPLPTHGVPFHLYVEKHRKWCRAQRLTCKGCNAKPVCDRLDANPSDPTLVDFSLKEYAKLRIR